MVFWKSQREPSILARHEVMRLVEMCMRIDPNVDWIRAEREEEEDDPEQT